ncbi:uncharacterized mitochondrial protein AtMg00300-like [Humulus lupulus]|uniref:uncharacterized mitochondrial protein AtMg00300-like n=1 Tax=Humulus lupulus TaxID=3486 RepID=UPI002B40D82C|nr:uncharacterized mitochondrial protein AtMg00300-like [Humulus lupulus]
MFDGVIRILKNFKYVSNLSRNLVSLSVLDDADYTVKIERGFMKICRGSIVVLKGIKDSLYYLIGETVTSSNTLAEAPTDHKAILWHKMLGQIGNKGLQVLKKQSLLSNDKMSKVDLCENCVWGKHHRLVFKVGQHNSRGILEYLYVDL